MNILLLGRGKLSSYFNSSLVKNKNFFTTIIPTREMTLDSLKTVLSRSRSDVVVDLLDPSTCHVDNFEFIQQRNTKFRSFARSICNHTKYFYISSSNLYKPSRTIIYEDSCLRADLNPYLMLKHRSEKILSAFNDNSFILRLPSILFSEPSTPPVSFFDDLLISRLNNTKLPPRDGDHSPFTYISALKAAESIINNLEEPRNPILNITTSTWSTRFNMKNSLDYQEENLTGLRISSNF